MGITVIILTKNEERHIRRCIESVICIANEIVVVDSGSTDSTIDIASSYGARVLSNDWINYSTQFNWALDQLSVDTEWVMRLDADEIVTQALADEISGRLPIMGSDISGIIVGRRMTFLQRPLYWGGLFPIKVVRVFRHGRGRVENRWMDEHVLVSGMTSELDGEIIDDNLTI